MFVAFHPSGDDAFGNNWSDFDDVDWEQSEIRNDLIKWLDEHHIEWWPCGNIALAHINCRGNIYVNVPYDTQRPIFKLLIEHLELPGGSMRIPGATLYILPLSIAMKNAAHDEPGFWERWAEDL